MIITGAIISSMSFVDAFCDIDELTDELTLRIMKVVSRLSWFLYGYVLLLFVLFRSSVER